MYGIDRSNRISQETLQTNGRNVSLREPNKVFKRIFMKYVFQSKCSQVELECKWVDFAPIDAGLMQNGPSINNILQSICLLLIYYK